MTAITIWLRLIQLHATSILHSLRPFTTYPNSAAALSPSTLRFPSALSAA